MDWSFTATGETTLETMKHLSDAAGQMPKMSNEQRAAVIEAAHTLAAALGGVNRIVTDGLASPVGGQITVTVVRA
jgi:hypothetical protein